MEHFIRGNNFPSELDRKNVFGRKQHHFITELKARQIINYFLG